MKNIIVASVVTALLILTGCSDKDPVVDQDADASQSKSAQESNTNDTVVIDPGQNGVDGNQNAIGSSGSSDDIASLEKNFESVYFEFDKFVITSDNEYKVRNGSNVANTTASAYSVKLEGNCDEWGSDEYNFALGLKRSNTVKKAMVAEGVDANRITMVSYGESNPICTSKTKDCWAKNRRVDFKLLP